MCLATLTGIGKRDKISWQVSQCTLDEGNPPTL
jgi:hypothetical protein